MQHVGSRIIDLLHGLQGNLHFSNGLSITLQRLLRLHAEALTYVWRTRLHIVCDCTHGDHFGLKEIFVERIYAPYLDRSLLSGNRITYVNIGAHIGAFDLWLREQGFVIEQGLGAEFNPDTCERCRRNLQANGMVNVRVINCAVAGQDGSVWFSPSPHSLGDSIFLSRGAAPTPDGRARPVEVMSLAQFLERHAGQRERFDLLKLDCEGAEYQILRLTPLPVLRRFRCLLVEFHAEPPGESVGVAYECLRRAGFGGRRTPRGPFPFIDLFVGAESGTGDLVPDACGPEAGPRPDAAVGPWRTDPRG